MLILGFLIYIILGLIIGTLIISVQNPRLYKQLKNEDTLYYSNFEYDNIELIAYIFIYYILWPISFILYSWFKFWKYAYKIFQKLIQWLSGLGKIINHYFMGRFKNDILNILKDKK